VALWLVVGRAKNCLQEFQPKFCSSVPLAESGKGGRMRAELQIAGDEHQVHHITSLPAHYFSSTLSA
jgi:hypothetical protein